MNYQHQKCWRPTLLLAAVTIALGVGAFDAAVAQQNKSIGQAYGSRDPLTC